ncbi:MAG TPA: hypothetical protein VE011_00605, partial [Candidatus Dormibacteraeota bacterium]|nr:hypothetical protein [Candidatus Dormibacteraeota bacterium]
LALGAAVLWVPRAVDPTVLGKTLSATESIVLLLLPGIAFSGPWTSRLRVDPLAWAALIFGAAEVGVLVLAIQGKPEGSGPRFLLITLGLVLVSGGLTRAPWRSIEQLGFWLLLAWLTFYAVVDVGTGGFYWHLGIEDFQLSSWALVGYAALRNTARGGPLAQAAKVAMLAVLLRAGGVAVVLAYPNWGMALDRQGFLDQLSIIVLGVAVVIGLRNGAGNDVAPGTAVDRVRPKDNLNAETVASISPPRWVVGAVVGLAGTLAAFTAPADLGWSWLLDHPERTGLEVLAAMFFCFIGAGIATRRWNVVGLPAVGIAVAAAQILHR